MFWISAVLIVLFVLMAAFPQLFTDPYTADLSKAREAPSPDAWFGRDGQDTTYTPAPSMGPEPRSWSVSSPRYSWRFSARSSASSPATEPAGWIRCSAASARSSSASRCSWVGSCFSTSSPTTR